MDCADDATDAPTLAYVYFEEEHCRIGRAGIAKDLSFSSRFYTRRKPVRGFSRSNIAEASATPCPKYVSAYILTFPISGQYLLAMGHWSGRDLPRTRETPDKTSIME
jgi:hypothetical protein